MLASLIATLSLSLAPHAAITAQDGTYYLDRSVGVETTGYGSDSFPTRHHWNRDHDTIIYTYRGRKVATFNGITFRSTTRYWLHIVADQDRL